MMQNLLINTPFISKLVSVPELFDKTVAPATSPPFPSLRNHNLCCVAEHLSIKTGIEMPTHSLHKSTHTHNHMHINNEFGVFSHVLKPIQYL